jgi:predicted RNA binding protein YcfA (HicA-like mRNA interferase family)
MARKKANSQKIECNSSKIFKRLEREGWELVRKNGSHHQFKFPGRKLLITLPHPRKDLPLGTARRIHKVARWL